MSSNRICRLALFALLAAGTALGQARGSKPSTKGAGESPGRHAKAAPTGAEAQAFMKKAEDQLEDLSVRASRASWVPEHFITDVTAAMSGQAHEKLTAV